MQHTARVALGRAVKPGTPSTIPVRQITVRQADVRGAPGRRITSRRAKSGLRGLVEYADGCFIQDAELDRLDLQTASGESAANVLRL